MIFKGSSFIYTFPRPALIMGIVNVTPDSFSDGGKLFDADTAVSHALKLVSEGAEIIDIGGQSTRPGAAGVSEEEELRRVIPVVEKLSSATRALISIDTLKPSVARAALKAGADIVNDIAANREDEEMWKVVAETGAGYVCMHMQGTPQTMQIKPTYTDVVKEVSQFFEERLQVMKAHGISTEQIVLDVGIGFGKTLEHNLQLLAHLNSFKSFERPLLVGVSRKSFIDKLLSVEVAKRVPASLACACKAVESGVQILRTHDVAETLQAVRMTEAIIQRE